MKKMYFCKKVFFRLRSRNLLNWMPDKWFLKWLYYFTMGKKLNIEAPVTFNEKLQWLKLYDRNPLYTKMVDKYEAKQFVAGIIGEEHIIPTLGIWERFEDIDFDALPNQFVLKCTHDSGGLVVCRDKSKLNILEAKKKIEKSLNNNYYFWGREWPYKHVKPRIIAEKYLEQKTAHAKESSRNSLVDYKFYCFNGEPLFLYISEGLDDHKTAKLSFLNLDWSFAAFQRSDFEEFFELPPKPLSFDRMVSIAGILSKNIPFVRVDLYEIDKQVLFSELTFSPCSGLTQFEPVEWDKKLGDYIELKTESNLLVENRLNI